ncbi:MAG: hypothetical protein A4E65_00306 [Syntrophorhabdus sp. PtaU1.Bin153]|nr:MAG: hypothetical protein A4E65_00306 [Syntrophorhabdus sp. PtaU1.Bin153]
MRHRVEVEGVGFTTEAQGFQRDGPTTGEHVEHLGTRGAAFFDILDSDRLSGLFGQPLGMGFEDVPLRVFDDGLVARILAEPINKFGCVSPAQTLFLVVRSILRDK